MTEADLHDVATLKLGGSRDPAWWIEWTRRNYERHGFGLWVIETHDGEFVGDCGLTMQEVEGEWLVEAGWHVRSALQRSGYASEAATSVRMAAAAAGIEHLVAIIRPTNVASQPRNGWGGIRIGLTGASDEAWLAGHQAALPVSRAAGLGSLLVGLALMIEGVTTRNEDGSPLFWTLTGVGYSGVLIAAVVAAVHAHRGATA